MKRTIPLERNEEIHPPFKESEMPTGLFSDEEFEDLIFHEETEQFLLELEENLDNLT